MNYDSTQVRIGDRYVTNELFLVWMYIMAVIVKALICEPADAGDPVEIAAAYDKAGAMSLFSGYYSVFRRQGNGG